MISWVMALAGDRYCGRGLAAGCSRILGGASEMLICSSRISTVVCAAVRHVRKRGRTGEMTVWDR